ncbi:hypothetical protein chiPu_0025227, partial [Chiloscyllium punctatum]|nr:hypothetical protein [Chiloscyllium punctatum]
KTISQTVQNTLNQLDRDCELIASTIDRYLQEDSAANAHNRKAQSKGFLLGFLGLLGPLFLLTSLVLGNLSTDVISRILGENTTETLQIYTAPVATFWSLIPSELVSSVMLGLAIVSVLFITIARYSLRTSQTLTKKQRRQLLDRQQYVTEVVKQKKAQLYTEYLRQSIGEHDVV